MSGYPPPQITWLRIYYDGSEYNEEIIRQQQQPQDMMVTEIEHSLTPQQIPSKLVGSKYKNIMESNP